MFTKDNNNSNFAPSGSEDCSSKKIIVHLKNPGNTYQNIGWNSSGGANLYAYNGDTKILGNWPGTYVSSNNSKYSYTFNNDANYDKITVVFSSEHDYDGNKGKTGDLELSKGYEYTFSLTGAYSGSGENRVFTTKQDSKTTISATSSAPFVALDNANNSSVSGTSATLYGYVALRGCATLTSYGFQYNTSKSESGATTVTTSEDHAIGSYNKTFTVSTSGTYYYRAVATNAKGTVYSDWSTETFTVVACTPPEALNFAITSNTNSYTYDGNSHRATVTSSNTSTYAPSSITEGYGSSSGSTTASKTAVGTYNIYVTAASADDTHGYCAVTSPIPTSIGTLTISEVTPSSENKSILFDITCESPVDFDGDSHGATVSWKSKYKDCGTITLKYYNGETLLDAAPINVGTYTVKISVASGTNNNASAADIEVGTITINKIDQSTAVTILNSGTHCIPSSGSYVDISASGGDTSEALTYSVVGTPSSGISLNTSTGRITANNAGSITVTATRPGGTNYNDKTSSNSTYTFVVTPTTITVTPSSAVEKVLPSSVAQPSVTQDITASHTGNSYAWTLLPNYSVNSIASASSANTTITFKREGVYTATAKGGCKNTTDVQDNSAAITVEPPLTIYLAGTLVSSAGDKFADNNFPMTRTSGSYVYTRRFDAVVGSAVTYTSRKFTLRESSSASQANYIIPKYAKVNYTNISTTGSNNDLYTTGITYSAGDKLEVRAEYKGYNSSENKPEWDISIGLVCDDPVAKTISISDASICNGSDVQVIVNSSQSGYIYIVYDSNNTQVGTATGNGSNKSITVTRPTASTTYTVKAKQAASCTPTAMSNTVSVTVNDRPTFSPSSGITQYLPVTVTSNAATPSWSIASKSPNVDAAWISNTSGTSTVLKAPTGTYTVSDGTCATETITVSNDSETCD